MELRRVCETAQACDVKHVCWRHIATRSNNLSAIDVFSVTTYARQPPPPPPLPLHLFFSSSSIFSNKSCLRQPRPEGLVFLRCFWNAWAEDELCVGRSSVFSDKRADRDRQHPNSWAESDASPLPGWSCIMQTFQRTGTAIAPSCLSPLHTIAVWWRLQGHYCTPPHPPPPPLPRISLFLKSNSANGTAPLKRERSLRFFHKRTFNVTALTPAPESKSMSDIRLIHTHTHTHTHARARTHARTHAFFTQTPGTALAATEIFTAYPVLPSRFVCSELARVTARTHMLPNTLRSSLRVISDVIQSLLNFTFLFRMTRSDVTQGW